MKVKSSRGFTLVELVMVLVLVGIVSLGALGLFASKGSYAAALAKDQFIAAVLQAQQRALSQHSGTNVTLRVVQSADEWFVSVFQGVVPSDTSCTTDNAPLFKDLCIERSSATLQLGATTLADGGSRDIQFTANGNTTETGNLTATFTGEKAYVVCVTQTGFAFDGACP